MSWRLRYSINSEEVAEELAGKQGPLMEAIAAAMGMAGESLYEAIIYNMTGGIIQSKSGLLVSAVQQSRVQQAGTVTRVWCEIPDNGSFEHLIGMVLEFGGKRPYDIIPLEARFAELLGLFKGGRGIDRAGVESMFSEEDSPALAEGRLPHSLSWIAGGARVFAKKVHREPGKAFHFMQTSLEQVQETVKLQLAEQIAGVLNS